MPYDMILYFRLPYFHVSNSALFLHSLSIFSFYIEVVFTLSLGIARYFPRFIYHVMNTTRANRAKSLRPLFQVTSDK